MISDGGDTMTAKAKRMAAMGGNGGTSFPVVVPYLGWGVKLEKRFKFELHF